MRQINGKISGQIIRLCTSLAAAILIGGCDSTPSTGVITNTIAATPGFVPGVPNGFQCPLVPNGFDPAGSIYRLDKSGAYYRVRDYSKEPSVMALNGIKRDIQISNYALSDQQSAINNQQKQIERQRAEIAELKLIVCEIKPTAKVCMRK